jgi:hypothetical protein
MQKKIVLALLLAAFIGGGAFAQISMSAGGGGFFDFSGNNGVKVEMQHPTYNNGKAISLYEGIRNTSFGAFAFYDVTYAELDVYFAYGSLTHVYIENEERKDNDLGTAIQFGFSLLGKYPIDMGGFTIFPLIGIDYNSVLSVDGNSKDAGDLSQFGLLAGIGGDISISGPLFIRLEGLLHLRFSSKFSTDMKKELEPIIKEWNALGGKASSKTTLGFGPQIKVAMGYKF